MKENKEKDRKQISVKEGKMEWKKEAKHLKEKKEVKIMELMRRMKEWLKKGMKKKNPKILQPILLLLSSLFFSSSIDEVWNVLTVSPEGA